MSLAAQNAFGVVNELVDATPARVDGVYAGAITSAFVVLFAFGCAGYATYGSALLADSLRSYPGKLRRGCVEVEWQ